jgi:fatty-acyl-CoA synthase
VAVDREASQAKLDRLAAGTLGQRASQTYTVAERLEERAIVWAERPFVLYEGCRLSYAELNALANRVAHVARAAGLRGGDVAALIMENRPEFIACWMGLAKLGVTTALINTNLRGQPLLRSLATSDRPQLFVGSECLPALAEIADGLASRQPIHVWRDPWSEEPPLALDALPGATALDPALAAAPATNPDAAVRAGLVAEHDLFHIFTSGTTGLPKAARLSHMRFLGVGDGMSSIAGWGADDVIACVLPLYHGAAGMVVVSSALAQGAAIALRRRFSARRFWDEVRRDGVTGLQYIGEICRYLLNQPPRSDDRDHDLRVMMGAGLSAGVWEAFQARFGVARILEGWSSTEANTNLINLDGKVGACGRIPFRDRHNGRLIRWDVETETHPRDARGFCIECGPGESGEFIGMILDLPDSGAGRFEGYTSAEETERKILRGVFQPGDAWYRSGDLLVRDEDDYYYFVDRVGDTFRWKSENVSTQEVAEALADFPGLEIANVYGVPVPGAEGRAGMAALVLRERDAFDGGAFFALTAERLPDYAAPLVVRLVAAADLTSTFKLRKIDLQREGYDLDVVRDPLYVRDGAARAYVPLTRANLPGRG